MVTGLSLNTLQIARLKLVVRAATRSVYEAVLGFRKRCFPVKPNTALRIVAVIHSWHIQVAFHVAALHEEWQVTFASSLKHARKLMQTLPVHALIYDYDSGEGDWRNLCSDCVQHGVCFQLIARAPTDDLFLSVISAGGSGVLWKPVTSAQIISSVRFAGILAEGPPTNAERV
jgi:hypothetical protein